MTLRGSPRRITACLLCILVVVVLSWHWLARRDFLITDVRYLQGDQIPDQIVNVGITGDKITYIGPERVRARTVIPGKGLILTPGLIDANSSGWLRESAAWLKLQDGITTFLNAHGDSFKADAKRFRVSERLNYATSVGLIPVQAAQLTGERMMAALEESLRYGAYTISLSPEYNAATTPAVVTELARHFARKNVLFTFHLRHSSAGEELVGVQEAIDCAAQGNPVHLLHLSSTGASYHPEAATRMIDAAVQRGLRITYDFYPYTAWSSSIHRARFAGDWRARYQVDFSRVFIPGESSPIRVGMRSTQARGKIHEQDQPTPEHVEPLNAGAPPLPALSPAPRGGEGGRRPGEGEVRTENQLTLERFEELQRDPAERNVIVDSIPQATVDHFALNTSCPIGTDSEANPSTIHPRGAGSFTKFINNYVDTGKISFAQAMHRFSTATAQMFAPYIPDLKNRGSIETGKFADLILWKREDIKSRADYEHPLAPSSGVVAAFVNGVPQILDGQPVPEAVASGRHLKGTWVK